MNLRVAWIVVFTQICALSTLSRADAPHRLDTSLVSLGSVRQDFLISPDGNWVVYSAATHSNESATTELFCVASAGGIPVRLNGDLTKGGTVSSWQFSPDGGQILYWADEDTHDLTEVYIVPAAGDTAVKINDSLVDKGSIAGLFAGSSGERVVYIGSQVTGPFTGPFYDLFSVSSAGGESIRLNDPLVNGGDVHQVLARGDGGRVLYLADQDVDEQEELYSVAPDTGSPVKLNAPLVNGGDVLADGLQFSPDGNHVLYAADQERDSVIEIFRVPTMGGTPLKLNGSLVSGGDVTPGSQRYSPDGSRVLYHADQNVDDVFEIFSVPSGGGTPVRLNGPLVQNGDVRAQGLQFSPDGSRVLYTADQDQDQVFELYSVPSIGGTPIKLNGPLVEGGDVMDDAVFSPDGQLVLYRADQDVNDRVGLYLVSATGGSSANLAAPFIPGGAVVSASFSPDGKFVVYLADQELDEVFELFSVPIAGGTVEKISGPLVPGGDVTDWQFSPDGQTVFYRADQEVDENFQIYRVALSDHLPGDFNSDGTVDAADYTVWRDGLGSRYSADDYGDWKSNFGRTRSGAAAGPAAQLAVPEPAAWILWGTVLASIRRGRRRERIAR